MIEICLLDEMQIFVIQNLFQDADKLVLGYMLVFAFAFQLWVDFAPKEAIPDIFPFSDEKVFVYVNLMLSKMNCVEQRIWLSIVGILR